MIITEPEEFRKRIVQYIFNFMSDDVSSKNIEKSIYNYCIHSSNKYNITKAWDNHLFVILYLDKFKVIRQWFKRRKRY